MRSSPRSLSLLLLLGLVVPAARASDLVALLAAVEEQGRSTTPAVADGTLVHRTGTGETRQVLRIARRGSTLRVDVGPEHALVRHGKALVRTDGGTHLTDEATLAGTNVRFGDLSVLTPRLLENPQIVDQGPGGTVIAAEPAGKSPYALLVVTIDPARAIATQVKYYEYAINNLVKRDGRDDFTDVAGVLHPGRITMWDVEGRDSTEIELAWHAAPSLGRTPFTRAGLAVPLAP